MTELWKSVAKKIGYSIAACIILIAALVCVVHFFTPAVEKHKGDFEKIASDLIGTPVTVQSLSVSWLRYQPEINLNDIAIINKTTHTPIWQIKRIRIFISIPKSIWQHKVVPAGLMLSGANISVTQNANGEYALQGVSELGLDQTPNAAKMQEILGSILLQPLLAVEKVEVHFTPASGNAYDITLDNLRLETKGDKHTLLGKGILHQEIPTEVEAVAVWRGMNTSLAQIKARIYLYVSGLSLSQWMKDKTWADWKITSGTGSAKIWAIWNQGAFRKIQSTFQLYNVDLYSNTDKSVHKVNRISGNVGWKKEGANYVFAGDDVLIDLPSHLWPVTSFYIAFVPDSAGKLTLRNFNVGYADLTDLQTFLFASPPMFADNVKQIITELQLKGAILNAEVAFGGALTDWSHIAANVSFSHIGFAERQSLPGLKNLSGALKWNGKQGDLSLQSNQVEWYFDKLFTQPVSIDQLIGSLQFQLQADNTWQLSTPTLQILNKDIAANVTGSLLIPKDLSPVADLKANFSILQANRITHYLPMRLFEPKLVTWLEHAFLSGGVKSATAIVKGKLSDMPFDQNNGTLSINASLNNIDLRYAPDWPVLEHVNGSLNFTGRRLVINVDRAQIMDMILPNVQGIIPYFGPDHPQILEVNCDEISTDFTKAMHFVHASPLEKNLGKMFKNMAINGPLTLKLGLIVPLNLPENTQVSGDIHIKNADANLVPWKLMINHLTGSLHFTEKTTEGKDLQAELFNKPLKLDVTSVKKVNDTSVVRVSFENNLNIADLESWLKVPFTQVAKGATDIKGAVEFAFDAPINIQVASNLQGVSVDLPDDFSKKAEEIRQFSAAITIQDQQPLRMKLDYGDSLSAALILSMINNQFSLQGANLHLGVGDAEWPAGPGLYITGNFDRLDWDKIKTYLNKPDNTAQNANAKFAGLSLRGIDIRAGVIDFGFEHLTQVRVQLTPNQPNWNIDITSPEMIGQVQIPMNLTARGVINAQFQRFNIHTTTSGGKSLVVDVKSLPAINFVANNVSYNDISLGQVTVRTVPAGNGLNIKTLRLVSPRMDLQATGDWSQSNVTHLQGAILTSDVSALLNGFGLDAHNLVSSNGKLQFNVSWHDAPYSPAIGSLNGRASLDMGKGRIVDVGAASGAKMDIGRMLSIFSLQTIPRRLTFDFSDVFEKGYSFDYVRGDYTFQNGNLFTNNMRFDGPVAKVGINGRIGLKDKDYDFTLSVMPYVTSSIPVAATLLTGQPLIGLAAMAVNTVINSGVSNATTYYYAVRGPWNNPTWNSIKVSGQKKN